MLEVPHVNRVWSVVFEDFEVALPDRIFNKTQHEYLEIAFRYLAVKETTYRYARGHLRWPQDEFRTAANLCNLLRELRIGAKISLGCECAE